MDRYTVDLQLYIWADSDKEAVKIAQEIQQRQRDKFDNRCNINRLAEAPFGRVQEREIQIESSY
jgi:hypothetical protein|tara:strand:+ start:888 stop:1079 length:192 start_codon:yes stop_codon:yes gene_type:complete